MYYTVHILRPSIRPDRLKPDEEAHGETPTGTVRYTYDTKTSIRNCSPILHMSTTRRRVFETLVTFIEYW
jgi:hypothetical protein